MSLVDRIEGAARRLRERRRRVVDGPERLWVELRGGRPADPDGFAARVEASPAVVWARWNGAFERLVVAHRGDPEAALGAVRDAEAQLGLAQQPFRADPPPHPADRIGRDRTVVRAVANVASIGLGQAMKAAGAEPRTLEIDLAALSAAFENLPQARRWLDRALGGSRSDLVLGLASSLTGGLAQGSTGQLVDLAFRGLRLAEVRAARQAWERREPELASRPEAHVADWPEREPRPAPLPKGPIERYSEPAGMASLGGFGFGVATTGRAEKAAGSIFGTVPRPARVGREAFAAWLGRDLSRRGWLVLEDRALRRLDRLDRIVLPHALVAALQGEVVHVWPRGRGSADPLFEAAHRLFVPHEPDAPRADGDLALAPTRGERLPAPVQRWVDERPGHAALTLRRRGRVVAHVGVARRVAPEIRSMVAHLREVGLTIAVITDAPAAVAWCAPERVVGTAHAAIELRSMQRHGHGVALVLLGSDPCARLADLTLALPRPGEVPWGAHLLAPQRGGGAQDAEDVVLLADAVDAARHASRQSVGIAGAEAAAGLVLSLQGQKRRVLSRIMTVSGIATLAAVANGVRVARRVKPRPVAAGDRTPWHALAPEEVLSRLEASPDGLTAAQVQARQVPRPRPPSTAEAFGRAVWREMASPFAPVLATGAGLSALAGSPLDAGLVAGTMLAGGLVSGWQQVAAQRAMRELEAARPQPVRVRRDGVVAEVSPEELVLGDVVELEAGDRVPADCRILVADRLEADESSLTGESLPIRKQVEPSFGGPVAERSSMIWADTTVAAGRAVGVVVAVGPLTEARRALLGLEPPSSGGVHERLAQITDITGPIAAAATIAVVGMGLLRNRPVQELVDGAVSLAVASVPETLPLLATAAQLAAARRLSEQGALVRNVAAVEALGRVDILCADKTGTLTEGVLHLRRVSDGERDAPLDALDDALRDVLRAALHATPASAAEVPHPTDRAVLNGAAEAGLDLVGWTRESELPFEPGRGYHATVARQGTDRRLFVKGAPEVVLAAAEPEGRDRRLAAADALAARGLRVLAVAERPADGAPLTHQLVRDLRFLGFVGIADPVRPTAREAIRALRAAGVDVMMITGDHPATARAIADELGLGVDGLLTGPELERLSDDELDRVLPSVRVFARATPQLKVRVVAALQRTGRVVAMTGDGANDAPAIRLADVGIALGSRATAAARGAADLLVTDERIDTLVDAVLEGRAMWASVRDAVSTLVGGNIGELAFTLIGAVIEGRAPIGARQLMLVNILTDALPALMIAVRPPGHTTPERLMGEGPDRSLGAALERDMAWRATTTGLATFLAWATARPVSTPERAGTIALLTLVGTQLGQTLWLGWRNPPVVAAVVVSFGALLVIVETPGLSRAAGSRVLGPVGLAHAGVFTLGGVLSAALVPSAWRWADDRVALEPRLARLRDSEVGRFVRESRFLVRLREAVTAEPADADDVLA